MTAGKKSRGDSLWRRKVVPGVPPCPPPWQRPSPLPRRNVATPCSRGPKPPASARTVPPGRGKRGEFPTPARRQGGRWCQAFPPTPRPHGKGHRLCHAATLPPASRGPKPPASARLAPAGTGAGLRYAGRDGLCRAVPQGRGKRGAFPYPRPETGRKMVPSVPLPSADMAKAIAFATPQRRRPPAGGQSPRPVSVFVKRFVRVLFPAIPCFRAGVCWRG